MASPAELSRRHLPDEESFSFQIPASGSSMLMDDDDDFKFLRDNTAFSTPAVQKKLTLDDLTPKPVPLSPTRKLNSAMKHKNPLPGSPLKAVFTQHQEDDLLGSPARLEALKAQVEKLSQPDDLVGTQGDDKSVKSTTQLRDKPPFHRTSLTSKQSPLRPAIPGTSPYDAEASFTTSAVANRLIFYGQQYLPPPSPQAEESTLPPVVEQDVEMEAPPSPTLDIMNVDGDRSLLTLSQLTPRKFEPLPIFHKRTSLPPVSPMKPATKRSALDSCDGSDAKRMRLKVEKKNPVSKGVPSANLEAPSSEDGTQVNPSAARSAPVPVPSEPQPEGSKSRNQSKLALNQVPKSKNSDDVLVHLKPRQKKMPVNRITKPQKRIGSNANIIGQGLSSIMSQPSEEAILDIGTATSPSAPSVAIALLDKHDVEGDRHFAQSVALAPMPSTGMTSSLTPELDNGLKTNSEAIALPSVASPAGSLVSDPHEETRDEQMVETLIGVQMQGDPPPERELELVIAEKVSSHSTTDVAPFLGRPKIKGKGPTLASSVRSTQSKAIHRRVLGSKKKQGVISGGVTKQKRNSLKNSLRSAKSPRRDKVPEDPWVRDSSSSTSGSRHDRSSTHGLDAVSNVPVLKTPIENTSDPNLLPVDELEATRKVAAACHEDEESHPSKQAIESLPIDNACLQETHPCAPLENQSIHETIPSNGHSKTMSREIRRHPPELLGSSSQLSRPVLTKPIEFTFASERRLEARRLATSSTMTSSTTTLGSSSSSATRHGIPDFKALHAANESLLASKRGLIKPVVAMPFDFHVDERLKQRRNFDEKMREKEREQERQQEERRREEEKRMEEEIRELRRKAIPKANEVPDWYKDAPKRRHDS